MGDTGTKGYRYGVCSETSNTGDVDGDCLAHNLKAILKKLHLNKRLFCLTGATIQLVETKPP